VDLVVGNWAADQPTGASGTCAWVANNAANQYPWALDACNVKRPFVCETKACIIGKCNIKTALVFGWSLIALSISFVHQFVAMFRPVLMFQW
jgi:hypothetical protein